MYMRANFAFLHSKTVISFNIFRWYFRYFVGTHDMLVGLHLPTNFQMYRQNSEKAKPPLATLMAGDAKEADIIMILRICARSARQS